MKILGECPLKDPRKFFAPLRKPKIVATLLILSLGLAAFFTYLDIKLGEKHLKPATTSTSRR